MSAAFGFLQCLSILNICRFSLCLCFFSVWCFSLVVCFSIILVWVPFCSVYLKLMFQVTGMFLRFQQKRLAAVAFSCRAWRMRLPKEGTTENVDSTCLMASVAVSGPGVRRACKRYKHQLPKPIYPPPLPASTSKHQRASASISKHQQKLVRAVGCSMLGTPRCSRL